MSQHNQHDPSFSQKEQAVMPFSTTKTRHLFQRTRQGGIQEVVALHQGDTQIIAAIRIHLRTEAIKFARGNFSSPAYLHGKPMTGLVTLKAIGRARQLKVRYQDQPTGAKLSFDSTDPKAINALHIWFAAQVNDHSGNAAWKK